MAISHAKSNVVADFTGTATVYNSQGSSTTIAATDLVRPSDWNSAHNETRRLSGATSNVSSATGNDIVYVGSGGLELQGTSNSVIFDGQVFTQSQWENLNRQSMNLISNATALDKKPIFFPADISPYVVNNHWMVALSRAATGINAFTIYGGLYTWSNSTKIGLWASFQNAYSQTNTANNSGLRVLRITGMESIGSTLSPAQYIACLCFSAAGGVTSGMNYSIRGEATANPPVGVLGPGTDNVTTNNLSAQVLERFQGVYTVTTAAPPATVGTVDISQWNSIVKPYLYIGSS